MTENYVFITDDTKCTIATWVQMIMNTPPHDVSEMYEKKNSLSDIEINILHPEVYDMFESLNMLIPDVVPIIYSYIDIQYRAKISVYDISLSDTGYEYLGFMIDIPKILLYKFTYFVKENKYLVHYLEQSSDFETDNPSIMNILTSYDHDAIIYLFRDMKTDKTVFMFDLKDENHARLYDGEIQFMNYIMNDNNYVNVPHIQTDYKITCRKNTYVSDTKIMFNDGRCEEYRILRKVLNKEQLKHNIQIVKTILDIVHHGISCHYDLAKESDELDSLL